MGFNMSSVVIRLQWLEWLFALAILIPAVRTAGVTRAHAVLRLAPWVFFAWALAAKVSQYFCLNLNAQDFWLFADLAQNIAVGDLMLTHFAPQAVGPVQHGAVHSFLPFAAAAYLPAKVSAVGFSLLWNPLAVLLAGLGLRRLLASTGILPANQLWLLLAFLFSKQVALMTQYEMHPESMYPALGFFAVAFVLENRPALGAVTWVLWGALKVDSILFLVPTAFVLGCWRMLGMGFTGWALGLGAQIYFARAGGPGFVPAQSGATPFVTAFLALPLPEAAWMLVQNAWKFLTSGSVRDLWWAAPWILGARYFWVLLLPGLLAFSIRGDQAVFWNYYSAPYLVGLWLAIALTPTPKWLERWLSVRLEGWKLTPGFLVLLLSLLNGSESLSVQVPSNALLNLRAEVKALLVENAVAVSAAPARSAVVSSMLLPFFDLRSVRTNVLPSSPQELSGYSLIAFPLGQQRYDLDPAHAARVLEWLRTDPAWQVHISAGGVVLATKR